MDEIRPFLRFVGSRVIRLPCGQQRAVEIVEFLLPIGFRPVAAVEMAAGMRADVLASKMRRPDMAEPLPHLRLRLGKTGIGAATLLVRPLIGLPLVGTHQIGAGEEIGELGAGLPRQFGRTDPELVVMRTVEGDDHQLLGLFFGIGARKGCREQGKDGRKSDRHDQSASFRKRIISRPNTEI